MTSSRCAVCKHFRRRCPRECIFAPYFPANNPQKFACVHRFYGASNVGKMLEELPVHLRADAIEALCYEAQCRMQDPVYGCVKIISLLHQELHIAQSQLAKTQAEIALLEASLGVVEPTPSLSESLVQQNGTGHGLDSASDIWFY